MELMGRSDKSLSFYTGESVFPVWAEVLPLLLKAEAHANGEWKVIDLFVLVSSGKQQLWVVRGKRGKVLVAAVTELVLYPRKTACVIYAMAGAGLAPLWGEFSSALFTWLEANQIDEVLAFCRDEIAEKLLAIGFRKQANVMQINWKEQS